MQVATGPAVVRAARSASAVLLTAALATISALGPAGAAVANPTAADPALANLTPADPVPALVTPAPASGTKAPPTLTPEQKAAAIARPAVLYLEIQWEGWVRDKQTGQPLDAKSVSVVTRCTGFAVSNDGYIVTAGHCVDPGVEGVALSFFSAIADRYRQAGMITQDQEPNAIADMITKAEVEGPTVGKPAVPKVFAQRGVAKAGLTTGEAIPAQVVSVQPVSKGDVALVKIEKSNQPMITLANSSDVQAGADVLAIGYPSPADNGAEASLTPAARGGTISAKRTENSLPFFETSADATQGMSGGPVTNLSGDVVGLISHGLPPGQPATNSDVTGQPGEVAATGQPGDVGTAPLNILTASSVISQALAKAGVKNELGKIDRDFRGGLDDYLAGRYTASIEKFDQVLAAVPSQAQAQEYRQQAVSLRTTQGDPRGTDIGRLVILAGAGVLVVVGAAVVILLLRRNRLARDHQPRRAVTPPKPARPELTYCTNCGQGASPGTPSCGTCGKQFTNTA